MMRKLSAIVAVLGVAGLGGCEPVCSPPFGDLFESREFDGGAWLDPPDGWTSGPLPVGTCDRVCPVIHRRGGTSLRACQGIPTASAPPRIAYVSCQYVEKAYCH